MSLFLLVCLNWLISLFSFTCIKIAGMLKVAPSVGDHVSFIQCAVIDRNMTLYASSLDVIGSDKAV